MGIDMVIQQVERLMEGASPNAKYAIQPGHFVHADSMTELEGYMESAAGKRPFFVEHSTAVDEDRNVSGNLVDSTHVLRVLIPYALGGSKAGKDARGMTQEQAKDWRRIRRCLAIPTNFGDGAGDDETGLMIMSLGKAQLGRVRQKRGVRNRISMLIVPLTALVREDWTKEPS